MLSLRKFSGLALVGLLTIASGMAADRLGKGNVTALTHASQRLEQVPDEFGQWQLQSSHELPAAEASMLECEGSLHRIYRHRATGQTVNMFVIVGPPGPTSVHSPEICYSSHGFEAKDAAQRVEIRAGDEINGFWHSRLKSAGPTPQQLDVVFAWSTGNGWVAPDYPRLAFAGRPYLYKLQLATASDDLAEESSLNSRQFLQDFLPVLNQALFAASAD